MDLAGIRGFGADGIVSVIGANAAGGSYEIDGVAGHMLKTHGRVYIP